MSIFIKYPTLYASVEVYCVEERHFCAKENHKILFEGIIHKHSYVDLNPNLSPVWTMRNHRHCCLGHGSTRMSFADSSFVLLAKYNI